VTLTLLVDFVLAALLTATIAVAFAVHRRMGAVRRDHLELKTLAASFSEAIGRAEESAGRLRVSSEALREQISETEGVRDDLQLLIERANAAADRLEAVVVNSRDLQSSMPGSWDRPAADKQPPVAAPKRQRSEAEQALLDALGIRDI
jgi:hypothetical protein